MTSYAIDPSHITRQMAALGRDGGGAEARSAPWIPLQAPTDLPYRQRVLFLFLGEPHHIFHSLPIAAEMWRNGFDGEIEVAVSSADHMPIVAKVLEAYRGFAPRIRQIKPASLFAVLRSLGVSRGIPRAPTLLYNIRYFRRFDAIVVPERTTTLIRHFLTDTKLIFAPHGAGDRAIMLDPRDRHFDFVLVAGPKSERRLLEAGTIRPGEYAVNGYVKMDFAQRLTARSKQLFSNPRPTVLYAPHFRHELSSWKSMGAAIIDAFSKQERYNLIVAPHIRMFHKAPAKERAAFETMEIPDKIIVDLSSERLLDMTYPCAADVYLGDVSSQVYEFLGKPRPCVFLNAHNVHWQGNPDYRFWTLGDVVANPESVLPAINAAAKRHALYRPLQIQTLADSIGGNPAGAASRGAHAITTFLESNAQKIKASAHPISPHRI